MFGNFSFERVAQLKVIDCEGTSFIEHRNWEEKKETLWLAYSSGSTHRTAGRPEIADRSKTYRSPHKIAFQRVFHIQSLPPPVAQKRLRHPLLEKRRAGISTKPFVMWLKSEILSITTISRNSADRGRKYLTTSASAALTSDLGEVNEILTLVCYCWCCSCCWCCICCWVTFKGDD